MMSIYGLPPSDAADILIEVRNPRPHCFRHSTVTMMYQLGLDENRTDELGLWVSPLRRGSSEGLPAALTHP